MNMSQTRISEVRIYVVSRGKNFSIRSYVCTCNSGFEDGERDTCAFITLYTSLYPDFKTLIIIFEFHLWVSGSERKPHHCHVPAYIHVSDFFLYIYYRTRAYEQQRAVQHDRDPFRLNIRIYGDRGLTLQGRYFIESYIRSFSTRGLGKDLQDFIFSLKTINIQIKYVYLLFLTYFILFILCLIIWFFLAEYIFRLTFFLFLPTWKEKEENEWCKKFSWKE